MQVIRKIDGLKLTNPVDRGFGILSDLDIDPASESSKSEDFFGEPMVVVDQVDDKSVAFGFQLDTGEEVTKQLTKEVAETIRNRLKDSDEAYFLVKEGDFNSGIF